MPHSPILVLAPDPERLRPAFNAVDPAERVSFVDDLAHAGDVARDLNPEIVLMYRDIGFDGPEFRELAHFDAVKWVHISGSGYEHLLPITRSDLTLSNGQGLRSRYLAETNLGALIALNGEFLAYGRQQRERRWTPLNFRPLQSQTLLIVGTGLIGTWMARYAKTLGMHVIGVNRKGYRAEPFDDTVRLDELDKVLPVADAVSVHLRHTPETERLFDARRFALMKPGALFLNTARGAIVDETALHDALQKGEVRGAYLDVFETEPLPEHSPLWGMENVLITPHAADLTWDWDIKAAEFFVDNLARWRRGETLLNVVRSGEQVD